MTGIDIWILIQISTIDKINILLLFYKNHNVYPLPEIWKLYRKFGKYEFFFYCLKLMYDHIFTSYCYILYEFWLSFDEGWDSTCMTTKFHKFHSCIRGANVGFFSHDAWTDIKLKFCFQSSCTLMIYLLKYPSKKLFWHFNQYVLLSKPKWNVQSTIYKEQNSFCGHGEATKILYSMCRSVIYWIKRIYRSSFRRKRQTGKRQEASRYTEIICRINPL